MNPQDLLKIIEFNQYNFSDVLSYIFVYLAILWMLFCLWVLRDISGRTNNVFLIAFCVLAVLIFNIPGLLIYLMLRPEKTIEEARALDLYQMSQLEDSLTTCRECKTIVRKHLSFCTVCGTNLYVGCEYCGKQINPIWDNCGYCGLSVYPTPREKLIYKFSKLRLHLMIVAIDRGRNIKALVNAIAKASQKLRTAISQRVANLAAKTKAINIQMPQIKITNNALATNGNMAATSTTLANRNESTEQQDSKKKEERSTNIVTAKNNFFLPS
jgi:hypothetical protein